MFDANDFRCDQNGDNNTVTSDLGHLSICKGTLVVGHS